MCCSFSAAVRLVVLGLFLYTGPASSAVSVTVFSGETVTLPCSAPYRINDISKVAVQWIKDDLGHVLVFEDGNVNPTKREQSFKDRVALADPELKNGNLSMILKNVTKNDEGLYECHIIDPTARNPTARKRRDASFNKPIQIIDLTVKVSVTVFSGETVTLPCSAPYRINDISKVAVEWIKDGLGHVLVFEDGNVNPTKQEQSFKDRVDLADPELKNRNLSMILKNVTKNDEGLYECHIIDPTARQRRAISGTKPIQTIDLTVKVSESVNSGETVTLPCSAPNRINDISKVAVEWTKPDLGHVLVFQNRSLEPRLQHQSFKDRVALADPELKNRNLSMILKNVTKNDEGLYECHFIDPTARQRQGNEPIQTIDLTVKEQPGDVKKEEVSNGTPWIINLWIITGIVGFVVVVVVVGVVVRRFSVHCKSKKNEQESPGSIDGLLGPRQESGSGSR